jgi:peptide-methionine (R)-S-oxide reductase
MDRRQFLIGAFTIVPAAFAGCSAGAEEAANQRHAAGKVFEITKTEDEWRKALTPAQFRVLREHDTERAGSSPLDGEKRRGTFHCAGCDAALFSSNAKFDSGTGWPSFTAPLEGAIGTSIDRSLFDIRTEVHCRRCGGHLGHVFDDGPRPTGKRYCMNGVALTFKPA